MVTPANVRVAVTGAVSKGAYGATAPTGTSGGIGARTDLGAISEDGVTLSLPDGGEKTQLKIWQDGMNVRTLRTTSDDLPQIVFTMMETTRRAIETYFGVTVTQTSDEGSWEYKVENRAPDDYILDVIDGSELLRLYVPRGVVASVGEVTFANQSGVGWQVTLDCELDSAKGYSLKGWSTGLGTNDESSSSSSS